MAIEVQNVPPEGLTDLQLENRLAFRQWGETPGALSAPGAGGSVRRYSPFDQFSESMIGEGTPCPVCGHPTYDCAHHIQIEGGEVARTVRTQGDPSANDDPNASLYVVPEDVVEVFYPAGSTRKSRRLVARKGEVILRERAVQLGLVEGAPRTGIPNAEIVSREGRPVGLQ